MKFDYQRYTWSDSRLNKISVIYDCIELDIFHDVLEKEVTVRCSKCAGMTQILTWDEIILENLHILDVDPGENKMIKTLVDMYKPDIMYSQKKVTDNFFELQIEFINHTAFSIICQEITFLTREA